MGTEHRSTERYRLTQQHMPAITTAMRNLLDAHRSLKDVRDQLVKVLETIDPTTEEGRHQERYIVDVNRAMDSLTVAVARIPDEFWVAHLNDSHAGLQEVLGKLRVA